jgi:hypothetical protein
MRFQRPGKRKYAVLTPEAKWAVLHDARRTRADPSTVLAIKSDPVQRTADQVGCHNYAADNWRLKEQEMYWKRTGLLTAGDRAHHASYLICRLELIVSRS